MVTSDAVNPPMLTTPVARPSRSDGWKRAGEVEPDHRPRAPHRGDDHEEHEQPQGRRPGPEQGHRPHRDDGHDDAEDELRAPVGNARGERGDERTGGHRGQGHDDEQPGRRLR